MHFSSPPHMDCHIEIFHEGQWLEAAQVSFSDVVRNGFRADDCVFEYDLDYAFSDVPPVSLAFPLSADRQGMQAWPAFLYDLVPQGNGRRFLLDRMQLPDAQASDLPLLCAGAFNPIGRQANQFKLLTAIRAVVDDPIADTIEFIQRDVLNLAMRNPDNHARNTAVQILDGAISMTPLFDFAPMYLDPEGITRAARWYHSENGKELQRWDDVLVHLALPALQHERLVEALLEFGAQLVALPATMREAGIDADIVDFVTPSIDAQRTQLLALRP